VVTNGSNGFGKHLHFGSKYHLPSFRSLPDFGGFGSKEAAKKQVPKLPSSSFYGPPQLVSQGG
jgi:hypothetical protein